MHSQLKSSGNGNECKPLVSGGFWMEAPHGLPNHMPQGEIKAKFQFILVQAANGGIRRSAGAYTRPLLSST